MEPLIAIIAGGASIALATSLRILKEYERGVIFAWVEPAQHAAPDLFFWCPSGLSAWNG